MESIFLEMSIENTKEKEIPQKELIELIGIAYNEIYRKSTNAIQKGSKWVLRIEFPSQKDFAAIYEKSFNMYVYLFDNFIAHYPEFENLFNNHKNHQGNLPDEVDLTNYMTLRYRTNCIFPIRQYFGFATRVIKIFGSQVVNEEIADGYLRFINTKADFLALLQPVDLMEDWKGKFKLRKVDLDHPLIIEFFKILEKYLSLNK